jgi:hypothetical protein
MMSYRGQVVGSDKRIAAIGYSGDIMPEKAFSDRGMKIQAALPLL